MTTKEIPVLLLTGYLGSGKTTLVNHILANKQGIRFAVIVNDIGEVNIDADLIQKGGIVGKKDESLVALQNGCICCTLKTDLIEQIGEIMRMERFDYIVIEASGICEPEPIAQTICSIPRLGGMYTQYGICRLDCITTVVDALRLQDGQAGLEQAVCPFIAPVFARAIAHKLANAMRNTWGTGDQHPVCVLSMCAKQLAAQQLLRVLRVVYVGDVSLHGSFSSNQSHQRRSLLGV